MAAAWTPQSMANDWVYWPSREAVTHREQTAIGSYSDHAVSLTHPFTRQDTTEVAKRRALTFREAAMSGGAYTSSNLAFLVPTAAFATSPKVGDQIRDASGVDHTILEATRGKLGNTWRFVTIALALVNGLRNTGVLYRPGNDADYAGKRVPDLAAIVSDIPCRVQAMSGDDGDDGYDGRVMRARYVAFLGQRIIPKHGDVFEVDGEDRYTIAGWEGPDRIDQLMTLHLDDITDGDGA